MATSADAGVVLFDGACNLCNAAVRFVTDRDQRGYFAFAPLQGSEAMRLLKTVKHARALDLSSMLLLEDGHVYDRSTAALRIARHLRGPWPLLAVLQVVPRAGRDFVYDWIARNRYRWFGPQLSCRLPPPELRSRFLR